MYSIAHFGKVVHGVDFGRENASKFYQNAVYTRNPSTTAPPLVLSQTAIEKFGGDIRSFPAFRNRFLELVEGRKDMEPRHKLQYLLQCLSDEPLREAKEYMISDENYFAVLENLEERYGNTTKLLHALDEALANLKPAGQSAVDLRRFHNQARRLVDEMKQAGHDINVNFPWKKALLTKLPPPLRLKIFEALDGSPMDVPMATTLTRLQSYVNKVEDSDIASPWKPATTVKGNKREGNRRCAYCGRDHWSLKCDIYKSVSQRMNRLRQLGYCFLCLRGGHWAGT
ncbi:Zinc knuckle family protein, partial [Aphelenchoides avenae]